MIKRVFGLLVLFVLTACSSSEPNLDNPQVVYQTYCFACHDSGAVGAPRLAEPAQWQPVFAQPEQQILQHTLKGLRAMPPRGTCLNCSDEQLAKVVDWIRGQTVKAR